MLKNFLQKSTHSSNCYVRAFCNIHFLIFRTQRNKDATICSIVYQERTCRNTMFLTSENSFNVSKAPSRPTPDIL